MASGSIVEPLGAFPDVLYIVRRACRIILSCSVLAKTAPSRAHVFLFL